jgi:integrase
MQRGQVYEKNGSWLLRYWEPTAKGRARKAVKIASVKDYPAKKNKQPPLRVQLIAEKKLAPINAGQIHPESSLSVADFIELYYLPYVKKELRPSTHVDYCTVFRFHLKTRLGETRLRDFRTMHAQRLLRDIPGVGHTSLLRIKSFLSGVFKHAKREGFLDGENPIRDTSVPGRPKKFRGEVYTMSEIEKIVECVAKVDMQAFAVISVAAFAGLRHAELRGLRWSDYDGESLRISRNVWRTHVGPTKTDDSAASVPVLPILKKVLDDHRIRVKGKDEDYIFAGERLGRPLNLANLVRRVIVPALANNEECLLKFKGFHAFRRSLASNLYSCGVSPKVIQAILRHSDIGTTLAYYVATPDAEAREALQKIEDWMAIV